MPFDEALGWRAYWELEPWGCLADDHRTEMLLRMNFAIHAKKGTKMPERFIDRDFDPEPKRKARPTRAQLEDNVREAFAGIKITRVVEGQSPEA